MLEAGPPNCTPALVQVVVAGHTCSPQSVYCDRFDLTFGHLTNDRKVGAANSDRKLSVLLGRQGVTV